MYTAQRIPPGYVLNLIAWAYLPKRFGLSFRQARIGFLPKRFIIAWTYHWNAELLTVFQKALLNTSLWEDLGAYQQIGSYLFLLLVGDQSIVLAHLSKSDVFLLRVHVFRPYRPWKDYPISLAFQHRLHVILLAMDYHSGYFLRYQDIQKAT